MFTVVFEGDCHGNRVCSCVEERKKVLIFDTRVKALQYAVWRELVCNELYSTVVRHDDGQDAVEDYWCLAFAVRGMPADADDAVCYDFERLRKKRRHAFRNACHDWIREDEDDFEPLRSVAVVPVATNSKPDWDIIAMPKLSYEKLESEDDDEESLTPSESKATAEALRVHREAKRSRT